MNNVICDAIQRRAVIQFYYDGGTREVEPHCHGTSTAGNEPLRGYQTAGYSKSGNSVGWKLFDVSQMRNIERTGEIFAHNQPQYNPNDRGMKVVHCHV